MKREFALLLFTSFFPYIPIVVSQTPAADTLVQADLAPVLISAYRLEQPELNTPLAVTTIGKFRLQSGKQQLALDESLAAVPGVFVQNGDNFSQDIKVSIRGFGARSAFGIRGIKILVDGFPETSPDGQGQVDNIDPGFVSSIQVIRGPTSGLNGNASGGAIHFKTLDFSEHPFAEASASLGSFGFNKIQFKTGGGNTGKLQQSLSAAFTKTNGYREYSAMKNYLLNGGLRFSPDSNSILLVALNLAHSPLAQDPGGITLQQATERPASARDRNVLFDASEKVTQGRVGLSFIRRTSANTKFEARAYFSRRDFSNKLPFETGGIVEFDRKSLGSSFDFTRSAKLFKKTIRAQIGVETDYQSDGRQRFNNDEGVKKDLTFDQQEIFSSIGIYWVNRCELTRKLTFSPGIRFDAVRLEVEDDFLSDGDQSSSRILNSLNPILGIHFAQSSQLNLYANLATNFETPALSELSANPTGGGGFNENLDPQKAISYEIGIKGFLEKSRLRYDAALFHVRLSDEFRPFELAAFPTRVFYQNANASKRSGIETSLGIYLGNGFYAYVNYTFSAFVFTDHQTGGVVFNDNALPGIPRHMSYMELRYNKSSGIYGVIQAQFIGKQYADDANLTETSSYWLSNMRLGYLVKKNKWLAEPFFGINNLFDIAYYSNLRINAAGGRYFEPAAGIHFFGGLKIRVE